MKRRDTTATLLGVMLLLLLSLSIVPSVVASSSQVSAYRFDAKGGKPGPPEEKPKPPKEAAIEYELFIEIDYMEEYEPNSTVLAYVQAYYLERGINVTFYPDDVVPLDSSVSDTDFWNIEAQYNDLGDDNKNAYDDPTFGFDGVYTSKWKWVLYGTTVENAPNVVGYMMEGVLAQRGFRYDLLAGNYIFIADETADNWAEDNGIEPYGAEAVVLMHELGHSIGIAKLDLTMREVYDSDSGSVMSYLSIANAGLYGSWYYSKEYWRLRNMEYYAI